MDSSCEAGKGERKLGKRRTKKYRWKGETAVSWEMKAWEKGEMSTELALKCGNAGRSREGWRRIVWRWKRGVRKDRKEGEEE